MAQGRTLQRANVLTNIGYLFTFPLTTMKISTLPLRKLLVVSLLSTLASSALAERPMTVDDAGTLARGDAKLELGWSKDDKTRGFEGAVGYGPIENVEVELAFGRSRDHAAEPTDTIRAVGAALKWVPLQSDNGLSAGLKVEYAHENAHQSTDARIGAINGLLSWNFAIGPRLHVNLGHEWVEWVGDADEDVNTWGVGLDVPVSDKLSFIAETFGAEGSVPDRQIGLRYEIADGLKLSGAVGRGNDRTLANLGMAWEF